jgi:hypothetical protein
MIGLGYTQGFVATPTSAMSVFQTLSQCQKISPNGSTHHEVRWLPSDSDESWVVLGGSAGGAGCVYLVGKGIDGTATSVTACGVNGYVEITTIWQWQPALTNALNAVPQAPAGFTTQHILSSISDLGAYLFDGVRTEAKHVLGALGRGTVRGMGIAAARVLTAGVGMITHRPSSLPLLTM